MSQRWPAPKTTEDLRVKNKHLGLNPATLSQIWLGLKEQLKELPFNLAPALPRRKTPLFPLGWARNKNSIHLKMLGIISVSRKIKRKKPHGFTNKNLDVRMGNGICQRSPPLCVTADTKCLLRNNPHPTLCPQMPPTFRTFAPGENCLIKPKENPVVQFWWWWQWSFKRCNSSCFALLFRRWTPNLFLPRMPWHLVIVEDIK